jgi:hypothetical protein
MLLQAILVEDKATDKAQVPTTMLKFWLEISKKILLEQKTCTLAVLLLILGAIMVALPVLGTLLAKTVG